MYNENNTIERRGKTAKLIGNMLDERKQLLSLLLQISTLESENTLPGELDLLDGFCQVLVDYIAVGHFGLYERIVAGTERRKNVADLALKVYPRIEQTTAFAVSFNEKYDPDPAGAKRDDIQIDLSRLGEELTNRIELEDQFIQDLIERKPKN